jgi:RecA/RadA recombinase
MAALVPKAKIDGEIGDSHMGLQAKLCESLQLRLQEPILRLFL